MPNEIVYDEDSVYDRTDKFATDITFKIISELQDAPEGKYDVSQAFYELLSQLIYAHKYIFELSDSQINEALADGLRPEE